MAAVEWKKGSIDYEKNQILLLLESARCNLTHGDRLNPKDKKKIARDIAASDPEGRWTEDALAEKLGVIQQTVNTWISDIRARQRAGRDIIIVRLNRLGWTQEQIAQMVGLSRNRISEIVGNTIFGNIDTLLSQGRDMNYIADHYNMDLALGWALRSFDLATSASRPEIIYHYWDPHDGCWPTTKKSDLIFFDPPYYTKKKRISGEGQRKDAINLIPF